MIFREPSIDNPIETKIQWAQQCYQTKKEILLGDAALHTLLKKFKQAAHLSHESMAATGIINECRACEERDGGSCCGAGLENKYSGVLLLINLLLGQKLPEKRLDPAGCFFLGKTGCSLLARHVICVNYLCKKINDKIPPHRLVALREKEGAELELLFVINEKIKAVLFNVDKKTNQTIQTIARFYDEKKVGDIGPLGFRRSTDLTRLAGSIDHLINQGFLTLGKSLFLDMGCADGRVNVLFSYLAKRSVGIELDEWTLDEYASLKSELETLLKNNSLLLPPDNISLFQGNSMDEDLYETIHGRTGVKFEDFDLFYTYLTMQEEFAGLIARKAKKGAVFMVYGLDKVMPRLDGLTLITHDKPLEGIIALYQRV
jgi:hypothetical protein